MKEIKKQERQRDSDEGIEWQQRMQKERREQQFDGKWEERYAWKRGGGFDIRER